MYHTNYSFIIIDIVCLCAFSDKDSVVNVLFSEVMC